MKDRKNEKKKTKKRVSSQQNKTSQVLMKANEADVWPQKLKKFKYDVKEVNDYYDISLRKPTTELETLKIALDKEKERKIRLQEAVENKDDALAKILTNELDESIKQNLTQNEYENFAYYKKARLDVKTITDWKNKKLGYIPSIKQNYLFDQNILSIIKEQSPDLLETEAGRLAEEDIEIKRQLLEVEEKLEVIEKSYDKLYGDLHGIKSQLTTFSANAKGDLITANDVYQRGNISTEKLTRIAKSPIKFAEARKGTRNYYNDTVNDFYRNKKAAIERCDKFTEKYQKDPREIDEIWQELKQVEDDLSYLGAPNIGQNQNALQEEQQLSHLYPQDVVIGYLKRKAADELEKRIDPNNQEDLKKHRQECYDIGVALYKYLVGPVHIKQNPNLKRSQLNFDDHEIFTGSKGRLIGEMIEGLTNEDPILRSNWLDIDELIEANPEITLNIKGSLQFPDHKLSNNGAAKEDVKEASEMDLTKDEIIQWRSLNLRVEDAIKTCLENYQNKQENLKNPGKKTSEVCDNCTKFLLFMNKINNKFPSKHDFQKMSLLIKVLKDDIALGPLFHMHEDFYSSTISKMYKDILADLPIIVNKMGLREAVKKSPEELSKDLPLAEEINSDDKESSSLQKNDEDFIKLKK